MNALTCMQQLVQLLTRYVTDTLEEHTILLFFDLGRQPVEPVCSTSLSMFSVLLLLKTAQPSCKTYFHHQEYQQQAACCAYECMPSAEQHADYLCLHSLDRLSQVVESQHIMNCTMRKSQYALYMQAVVLSQLELSSVGVIRQCATVSSKA